MNSDLKSFLSNPLGIPKNIFWRMPRRRSTRRYVFVLGASRSGTSLIKAVLCSHSAIGGTKNEGTFLFKYRDIYRLINESCGYADREEVLRIFQTSYDFVEFYDRVSDLILSEQGKSYLADKYISHKYINWYVLKYFPNAQIVFMIRDPRDVYCSVMKHTNLVRKACLPSARFWNRCIQSIEPFECTNRVHCIRYEDLVREPEHIVGTIMKSLGLGFENRQLDSQRRDSFTNLGSSPNHKNISKPIGTFSVGRWRHELSKSDVAVINSVCEPYMRRFGYA